MPTQRTTRKQQRKPVPKATRRAPAAKRTPKASKLDTEITNYKSNSALQTVLEAAAGSSSVKGSDSFIQTRSMLGFDISTTSFASTDSIHYGYRSAGKILSAIRVEYLQPSITDMTPSDAFIISTGIACGLPSDLPSATTAATIGLVPMATQLTWITPTNVPKWRNLFSCNYMKLYRAGLYPTWMDINATDMATATRRAFTIQVNSGNTSNGTYTTLIGGLDVTIQLRVHLHWWDPVEELVSVTVSQNTGTAIAVASTTDPTSAVSSLSSVVTGLHTPSRTPSRK